MIKHIVTFKLAGNPEERLQTSKKFKEALMNLPGKIETLKSMEVGVNSNPDEDWDIVLTAIVDDMNGLKEYATHPLHVKAASIIKDIKAARACVDYEI